MPAPKEKWNYCPESRAVACWEAGVAETGLMPGDGHRAALLREGSKLTWSWGEEAVKRMLTGPGKKTVVTHQRTITLWEDKSVVHWPFQWHVNKLLVTIFKVFVWIWSMSWFRAHFELYDLHSSVVTVPLFSCGVWGAWHIQWSLIHASFIHLFIYGIMTKCKTLCLVVQDD